MFLYAPGATLSRPMGRNIWDPGPTRLRPTSPKSTPGAKLGQPVSELTDYAALLRRTIDAKSSRRKLSFALANQTGNKQPSEFRSLGKYLAGDELPTQERAARLAVLLEEPLLAIVSGPRDRQRRDRLGELAATVEDLTAAVDDLKDQVAELKRQRVTGRRVSGER